MELKTFLRSYRKSKKLSVRQFAEMLDVSKFRLEKWEKGVLPNYEDEMKIKKYFRVKDFQKLSEEFFKIKWTFLIAPQGTSFITSDNPCFTISKTKIMNGLLSPNSTVIFPLRPDVCLYAKVNIKNKNEQFIKLDKSQVKDINKLILLNSYECIVTKDIAQLNNLTKTFDYKNHRKSRDISVSELGDYVMFNVE